MKRYLSIPVILILFLFSCKKADRGYPYVYNPIADYLPTKAGSTWTYGISFPSDPDVYLGNITVTMSSDQVIRNGKAYFVATAGSADYNGVDKFYFYKDNAKYKAYWAILPDYYGTSGDFDVPILLNDSVINRDTSYYIPGADPSKPAPWEIQTYTNPVPLDVTITGKTYHNCITSSVTILNLNVGTDPQYAGKYDVYNIYGFVFAPNVGIIKEEANNHLLTLMSSDVKQ